MERMTLDSFLKNAKRKLGAIGEQALHTATVETPELMRTVGEQASGLGAARSLNKLLNPRAKDAREPVAEMRERPGFGTPQSDPGSALAGAILGDPLNLVPAAPAAGRLLKAGVERFALPKIERMATASILPSEARRAGQMSLPGVPKLTLEEEREAARRQLADLRDKTFETGGPAQRRVYEPSGSDIEPSFTVEPYGNTTGVQDVRYIEPTTPSPLAEIDPEGFNRARDILDERLTTRGEINRIEADIARRDRSEVDALIDALRGKRSEGGNLTEAADLEGAILDAKRRWPLFVHGREAPVYLPENRAGRSAGPYDIHYNREVFTPESQADIGRIQEQRLNYARARDEAETLDEFLNQPPPEAEKPAWARDLTRLPTEREGAPPQGRSWWVKQMEEEPKRSLEAFLEQAREQPNLFTYGLAPPRGADIARHYTEEAADAYRRGLLRNEPGTVRIDYTDIEDYDEPYKIPKEHGRGEIMRDRYGDYKYETYEPGAKMYERDTGDLKKIEKEKELTGPPEEWDMRPRLSPDATSSRDEAAPRLIGTKEVPKRAEGGEWKVDESGELVFRKSRGGEYVRDEYGNIKKVENEDYSGGQEGYEFYLSDSPEEAIKWTPGEAPDATSIEKGGERGALLYQVMNSKALREGIDIPSGGFTTSNQYRMLPNSLSTYARHGEQPRYLRGLEHGEEPAATGQASGFDIWRAYAGATEARLPESKRISFDGGQFLVDGVPTAPRNLADAIGVRKGQAGVGDKSLMARALYRYLENATPEEAARIAREWSSKLGPVFSGFFGTVPGLNEYLQSQQGQ